MTRLPEDFLRLVSFIALLDIKLGPLDVDKLLGDKLSQTEVETDVDTFFGTNLETDVNNLVGENLETDAN